MLFPTIDFAVFFVIVFTASWLLRPWPRAWKLMILAASFVFYGWWDWRFTFLLAASIAINEGGALLAVRLPDARRRRWALIGAVAADIALLGWFKYYGFFAVNVANALGRLGLGSPLPILQVALPVGISFFTFMGISYVVDAWRGRITPAGWLDSAVYLSFFPHLVAGPIVRGSELLPQLDRRRDPRRIDASRAGWLIMGGLAKKVVISSFLARNIVDPVFALPHQHSALEVLFAIYGYAVQIYADFSGYTDIAIGVALLLGFRFPENFNAPYAAVSMQDFWRRWHMTLSSWLRDYLYIPLGGNRHGTWRTAVNILVTMLIAGLWHGAAWTFVAWGAYHGVAQVTGMLRRERRRGGVEPVTESGATGSGPVAVGSEPGQGPVAVPSGPGQGPVAVRSGPGQGPVAVRSGPGQGPVAVGSGAGAGGGLQAAGRPASSGGAVLAAPAGSGSASAATAAVRELWSTAVVRARAGAAEERSPSQIWLARLVTFHLVCLGWVLFRAQSFSNAVAVLSRLAHPGAAPLVTPLVIGAIVVSIASQYVPSDAVARAQRRFSELAPAVQGVALGGALYLITLLGPVGVAPFIYYRF